VVAAAGFIRQFFLHPMGRSVTHLLFVAALVVAANAPIHAQQSDPSAAPPLSDEMFETGRLLFEQLAPPEVKARYRFPSRAEWDAYTARLLHALQGDSLSELASFAQDGRQAIDALRLVPGFEDVADWLQERIDEMEGAQTATTTKPRPAPVVPPVPYYDLWVERVRGRPVPSRAAAMMPAVRAAFIAEGVPPELAWVAETESSLNPTARSPVGARGLFQLMPDTARELGLRTFLPDERTDPAKSARAAARYLRTLHGRFGNWALALAAYNAGPGRIARTLAAEKATTFTAIAQRLPAETRMYVPKTYALIAARTGVTPYQIPPPR
jgi:membrane-bound lytic murein transglycosylase D